MPLSGDERDETAKIVEVIGGDFMSLAKARSKGFEFKAIRSSRSCAYWCASRR